MNNLNRSIQNKKYFANRNIGAESMMRYKIPPYLLSILPEDKGAAILDVGCGFGHVLDNLRSLGYTNLSGIDISDEAILHCHNINLNVEQISSLEDFFSKNTKKYDFIIMTHVIEHINKEEIIKTLTEIKNTLTATGALYLTTPNAQSNTGSYWMFEDFTHTTIFTSGSLIYVLRSAGFDTIEFLDPADLARHSPIARIIKKIFLKIYKLNKKFWNKVTASSYHKPSPEVYSFELKVLAK